MTKSSRLRDRASPVDMYSGEWLMRGHEVSANEERGAFERFDDHHGATATQRARLQRDTRERLR
jgi:hypothetical protein